jgi:hypothetical protein
VGLGELFRWSASTTEHFINHIGIEVNISRAYSHNRNLREERSQKKRENDEQDKGNAWWQRHRNEKINSYNGDLEP